MILFNGLLGLLVAPFAILAVGVWMCFMMIKVIIIGIAALGCFIVGLARAAADQHRRTAELQEGAR